MKKPPSASVRPPIHTTQRVPMVSSKPRSGCGKGGGGAAGGPSAVSAAVSVGASVCGPAAGGVHSASGAIGGGSAATPGEAGAVPCSNIWGSGGGTGLASAAAASILSSRASQLRDLVHRFDGNDNGDNGEQERKNYERSSNIRPPGGRAEPLTGLVSGPSQCCECSSARKKFKPPPAAAF